MADTAAGGATKSSAKSAKSDAQVLTAHCGLVRMHARMHAQSMCTLMMPVLSRTRGGAHTQKFYKKKPDPEGAKLIEQGEEALKAGDFGKAKGLFDAATELCKASTAQAEKPKKEPKPAAEGAKEDAKKAEGAQAGRVLLLSSPAANTQAKPLREGVDASHNYARNTPEQLAQHLQANSGAYLTRFPPPSPTGTCTSGTPRR